MAKNEQKRNETKQLEENLKNRQTNKKRMRQNKIKLKI